MDSLSIDLCFNFIRKFDHFLMVLLTIALNCGRSLLKPYSTKRKLIEQDDLKTIIFY